MKSASKKTHKIIESLPNGEQISFPLAVVRGNRDGPTLGIIAGIHGGEFCGVEAALQIYSALDPKELQGEIRIVPVANLSGFMSCTMFCVPQDGKKLSTAFPGASTGSYTEKLASILHRELISKSDYVVEFRGGELVETMATYVSTQRIGDKAHDVKAEQFAKAFGARNLILLRERRETTASESANTSATYSGKLGLLAEAGGQGLREKIDVDFLKDGIFNVLAHLGMLKGRSLPADIEYRYLDSFVDVVSPVEGIFDWKVDVDEVVERGDVVGLVRDFSGATLAEITVPERGVILGIVTAPGVREGTTVIGIGRFM